MAYFVDTKLKQKSNLTKKYYKKGHYPLVFEKLVKISNKCSEMILISKENYILKQSNTLNAPQTLLVFFEFALI